MKSENEPKFNPEYEFLEIPEILILQTLVDSIVSETDGEKKQETLKKLKEGWDRTFDLFASEAKADNQRLKSFIKFTKYNLHMLGVGGMGLGRSEIHNFLSAKNEELEKRYSRLIDSL